MMITTLQLILIVLYVGPLWAIEGVLSSISASSYLDGPWKYLFYLWLGSLAFLNVAQGLGAWGFWASAGLLFAGVTYNHREKLAGPVHYVGTLLAIACTAFGLGFVEGMWWPLIAGALGSGALSQVKNPIWHTENWWFAIILVAYFVR